MDYSLISLVCYGNGYIAGKRWQGEPSGFNTKYGDYFFVRPRDGGPDEEVATSPESWFAWLAGAGARGLRIAHTPDAKDHQRVWMKNGVVKAVEVLYPSKENEFWTSYLDYPRDPFPVTPLPDFPRLEIGAAFRDRSLFRSWLKDAAAWPALYARTSLKRVSEFHAKLSHPKPPPQKPWKYMHRLEARGPSGPIPPTDLAQLTADLKNALTDIHAFAIRTNAGFIENFAGALDVLDGRAPPSWTDIAPEGVLSPEAVRLLCACSKAWVFGGMMSWNDNPHQVPNDPLERERVNDDYDRVTAAAYLAISRAIVAATNSSCNVTHGAA